MVGSRACGLFVIASLLCCGLAAAAEQPSAAQMMDDLMYGRGRVGGPFTLTDQTGKQRSDTDFRGKLMIVYFLWDLQALQTKFERSPTPTRHFT